MKLCACCQNEAPTADATCAKCGEASWGPVFANPGEEVPAVDVLDEPGDEDVVVDSPPRKRGRK